METAGDVGWVVAEQGRHAAWVRNVEAHPHVRVRIGRRWRRARAEIAADDNPEARLDAFERRSHAAVVRRFGTDLTTVRFDFDKQRSRAVLALNEPVVYGAGRIITMRPFEPVRRS